MYFTKLLSFRLAGFLLVAGLVIFIPMTILTVRHARNSLEHQAVVNSVTINNMVLNTTMYSMLKNDEQGIQYTLKNLGTITGIENVRIYGKGKIAFSTIAGEQGRGINPQESACIVCHRSASPPSAIPKSDEATMVESGGRRHLVTIIAIPNSNECAQCHPAVKDQRVLGVVQTTVSMADVDVDLKNSRRWMILLSALAVVLLEALVVGFIFWYVHRRVARLAAVNRQAAGGDLKCRSDVAGADEIGMLSMAFNGMMDRIEENHGRILGLLKEITEAVQLLTNSSGELSSISAQQASGATEQVSTVHELVATAQEFSQTSQQIAENSLSVKASAEKTFSTCEKGKRQIQESISQVNKISHEFEQVSLQMNNLGQTVKQIGGIIDLIEEISDNTGLLALNAAIEAAGAGAAGSRFAVVADEVRRLSNKTLEATELVRKSVQRVQQSVETVLLLEQREEATVAQGLEAVRKVGTLFQETMTCARETLTGTENISVITRQQISSSEQMVGAIREVQTVADESEQASHNLEAMVKELSAMSERLRELIAAGTGG